EEMIIERLKGEPEVKPELKPELKIQPEPKTQPKPVPKPQPKPVVDDYDFDYDTKALSSDDDFRPEKAPAKNPSEGRKKKDMKFEMIDFDD
ncbi:MAG: hypothetical protein J5489_01665, partial [Lachnospiraceae bacterium]|nr:hypothetical protein [Lachnospiraceae bacterium]